MVRWTEDFDCEQQTNWWYIVKDSPFDIGALKAKRRYEINKGIKSFDVRKIEKPEDYAEPIFEIMCDAYKDYPKAYRPLFDRDSFVFSVKSWSKYDVYGAFSKKDGLLKAWGLLKPYVHYSDFEMMKSIRSEEKLGVNAALINGILEDYNCRLIKGYYICDGSRNISHETSFQEYLEKYFGFRKAYCRLRVEYAPMIRLCVSIIYPFRKLIRKLSGFKFFHNISSILQMEEYVRQEQ